MISVAMTTYNGEHYVEEQLSSIIHQSRQVNEIIICDDCSKDHTTEIIRSFQNQYKDINIKLYINEKNVGYRDNFKKAISLCSGDYIFLSDQDDIWKKEKVEEMIKMIQAHPNIEVLASSFSYIDEHGAFLDGAEKNTTLYQGSIKEEELKPIKFEEFLIHNYFQGCTLVFTKTMKDVFLNYFTNEIPHDWLIVILSSTRNSMYFWNHSLSYYRLHGNNAIGVDDFGKSKWGILKRRFSFDFRTKFARDGLNLIQALYDSGYPFDLEKKQLLDDLEKFYKDYISALKKGKMPNLSKARYKQYYSMFRTRSGALMDRVYCLFH